MVATAGTTMDPGQPSLDETLFEKSGKVEPAIIGTLRANPWQPRLAIDPAELEQLKQSIRDFGFLGYVPVRRADEGDPLSPLQIVYGHRRVRAAEMLGQKTVPVMLCKVSDEAMMRLAFVENSTQKRMTYWEEALHFAEMKRTLGLTVRKLADMLGLSRSYVQNRLQILQMPEDSALRRAAEADEIAMSNALAFVNLSKVLEPAQLETLLDDIRQGRLAVEDLVALQRALDASVPGEDELTDDGQRIKTVTLVEQARNRELTPPKSRPVAAVEAPSVPPMDRHQQAQWDDAARRATAAEEAWNEIAGDLPDGPSLAQAGGATLGEVVRSLDDDATRVSVRSATAEPAAGAERSPIRFESSNFRQKTGGDYALQAVDLLEGFLPNLRRTVDRADFAALDEAGRTRLEMVLRAFDDLVRERLQEPAAAVRKSASGD